MTERFLSERIDFMLIKKDLSSIESLIKKNLREFFETLILPYFEQNEKDHAEIRSILRSHDKRFDSHDKNFDTQDKDLDSIQRKLEKNEDDHEEMFKRLGKVERSPTKLPSKN